MSFAESEKYAVSAPDVIAVNNNNTRIMIIRTVIFETENPSVAICNNNGVNNVVLCSGMLSKIYLFR